MDADLLQARKKSITDSDFGVRDLSTLLRIQNIEEMKKKKPLSLLERRKVYY